MKKNELAPLLWEFLPVVMRDLLYGTNDSDPKTQELKHLLVGELRKMHDGKPAFKGWVKAINAGRHIDIAMRFMHYRATGRKTVGSRGPKPEPMNYETALEATAKDFNVSTSTVEEAVRLYGDQPGLWWYETVPGAKRRAGKSTAAEVATDDTVATTTPPKRSKQVGKKPK